jgi:hypothetical protein
MSRRRFRPLNEFEIGDELEQPVILDMDSDCVTESESSDEGSASGPEEESSSSSSPTWGPRDPRGQYVSRRVNTYSGGTLHFVVLQGLPHGGQFQLDDAGGIRVYSSSCCEKIM